MMESIFANNFSLSSELIFAIMNHTIFLNYKSFGALTTLDFSASPLPQKLMFLIPKPFLIIFVIHPLYYDRHDFNLPFF